MSLTKTEVKLLKDLAEWDGKYNVYWTVKTREKLEGKGFAVVNGNHVALSEAGREALMEIEPEAADTASKPNDGIGKVVSDALPPFEPRIYSERGYDFYEDGRVNASIDIIEHGGGIKISEWFCAHQGRGCTTEALKWLRDEGYPYIVADQVIHSAMDYWKHMMSKGLVDAIYDECGRQRAPEVDDSPAHDPIATAPPNSACKLRRESKMDKSILSENEVATPQMTRYEKCLVWATNEHALRIKEAAEKHDGVTLVVEGNAMYFIDKFEFDHIVYHYKAKVPPGQKPEIKFISEPPLPATPRLGM